MHNRILIIGATGNIGRHVVSQLAATGAQIRALARNPGTAALPPQVDVMRADLTLPETLDTCLDGIETVFMVWVSPADTFAPVLDRIAKYARRIVFLSAPIKTAHPLFQQPNPSRARTEQFERMIEKSGLQWTFLRPGMLASNALGWWAPQIKAGDVVRWPHLAVPTAPIDERDIAAVAVPSSVAAGSQQLILTTAVGASPPYSITVNQTPPGLLALPSFDIGGRRYAAALFPDNTTYVLPPGAIPGVPSRRAKPGDTVVLYGVGFGSVTPNIPAGQVVQHSNTLALPLQIFFGQPRATTVSFAGLAPGGIGLYQFNVVVPNVAASDVIPLTFTLGGVNGTQVLVIAVQN